MQFHGDPTNRLGWLAGFPTCRLSVDDVRLIFQAFAERVKDWYAKLEEGERAFVHQLKMKAAAKWPKNFVRLDLI